MPSLSLSLVLSPLARAAAHPKQQSMGNLSSRTLSTDALNARTPPYPLADTAERSISNAFELIWHALYEQNPSREDEQAFERRQEVLHRLIWQSWHKLDEEQQLRLWKKWKDFLFLNFKKAVEDPYRPVRLFPRPVSLFLRPALTSLALSGRTSPIPSSPLISSSTRPHFTMDPSTPSASFATFCATSGSTTGPIAPNIGSGSRTGTGW